MLFYPGVAMSNPIVASAVSTNVASTNWEAPSIDTAGVDGCRIVACYGANVSTNTGFTPDTAKGHTRRALHGANTAPARRMVSTDALQSAGGVTGTITATSASSGTPIMATVALRPAPLSEETPAAPRNLTATGQTGGVLLDWDDVTTAGLDGYNVYRSTVTGATKSKINSGVVATSTFTDTSETAGTAYFYAVTAVNNEAGAPESDHSNEASAVPAAGGGGLDATPTVNRNFSQRFTSGGLYRSQTINFAQVGVTLTAGRLAVIDVAVDKSAGEFLTISGWNKQSDVIGTGVSVARYTRVVDGSEAGVTVAWTSGSNGSSVKLTEWNVPNPQVEATNSYGTGGARAASGTVGPPPSATQNLSIALASIGVDALAAWGNSTTGSVTSWSGGFASLSSVPANSTAAPGLEVAALSNIASGSSPQTTATWTGSDEWAGILTVVRSGPAPAPSGTAEKPRVGAATASGFQVAADVSADVTHARLLVSNVPDLSNPSYFEATIGSRAVNGRSVMKAIAEGLDPNQRYYYGWELNGSNYGSARGSIKTFPTPGLPHSGTIVGATCNQTNTPFYVGDNVQAINPDVFVHYGDIHYRNETSANADIHTGHMQYAMAITKMSNVFRNVPTFYVMDDHERENAAHKNSTSMAASNAAWDEYFPHHTRPDTGQDTAPVLFGRVWLVPLDTRSYRDRWTELTDSTRTMLGGGQKQRFINFCTAHPNDPKLVFMGSSWIGGQFEDDHWGAYQTERTEIVDALQAAGVRNVIIVAGDMHAVASDDGRNAPGGYPVFHWAPFHQAAHQKGGPYLNGPSPASGTTVVQQYGRIDVDDAGGDELSVTFRGRNLNNADLIDPLTVTLTGIGQPVSQTLTPSRLRSATNLTPDGRGLLVGE